MKLTNITNIVKELQNKVKKVNTFKKIDGISVECIINEKADRKEAIQEVINACKELKLTSPLTEENKENKLAFALQFPDLNVEYSDKEFKQLVEQALQWLLDNMYHNDKKAILTKDVIIHNKGIFEKQIIGIYYNSHTNKYKQSLKELLNNQELRQKVSDIFDKFIITYEYTTNK